MAHVMAAMNMHVHLYNGNFQPDMLCKTWIKGTENYSPKYLVSCVSLVGFQLKRKLWSGTLCGACRGKKSKAKNQRQNFVLCVTQEDNEKEWMQTREPPTYIMFSALIATDVRCLAFFPTLWRPPHAKYFASWMAKALTHSETDERATSTPPDSRS